MTLKPTPLGIYIHWPYCARICPYCDFNVYKRKSSALADTSDDALIQAIVTDLGYWREQSGPRPLRSIHFGGGTPSLLSAAHIQHIISVIDALWGLPSNIEIALEANPTDQSEARWHALKQAGINRLSMGVQSFDDQTLSMLGRDHDGQSAQSALKLASSIFPRLSADLIFGHKGQSQDHWARDLQIAIESGAGHISAYQLTIEAQTAFGRAAQRGDYKAVGSDQSAAFYEQARTLLSNAGYEQYEVSNYAKPGQQSQHNTLYWLGYDYVGVGPGAHGRLTRSHNGAASRQATVAHLKPKDYIQSVNQQGHGLCEMDDLSPQEWAEEYLMMGLRLEQGISQTRFNQINQIDLNPAILADLEQMNLLILKGDNIKASPDGRMVLDTMTRQLLAD